LKFTHKIQFEMMKKYLLIILLASFFTQINAQNETQMEHVPKQYSVELGYRYNFDNPMGYNSMGYSLLFDYAWQLSGFKNKKAAFISVPLGYTYFAKQGNNLAMRLLSYGWTVRHELAKDKKIIPFLNYGLLLNKINFEGTDGALMGHKTMLGGGINISMGKLKTFVRLDYNYTTFYQLNADKIKLQGTEFAVGVRF